LKDDKNYDSLKLKNQICFPLYACSKGIVKKYTPYLNQFGITYTQYIVLMVLWENDGINVSELGNRLFLDSGTLTPVIKKLEGGGLVQRKRSEEDERVVTIFLTEKGWELREKALDIPKAVSSCVDISKEEAETLYHLLYKILGNLE